MSGKIVFNWINLMLPGWIKIVSLKENLTDLKLLNRNVNLCVYMCMCVILTWDFPEQTYADSSKRLELRFRPKDQFCHPAYGNRFSSTNLLLRVRRRTRKGNSAETQISMEIVGLIGTTYKFQGIDSPSSPTSIFKLILVLFLHFGVGFKTFHSENADKSNK